MIIWIASYPKSGNTWVRALLSAIIYSKDGKFSFDLLKKISLFPLQQHLRPFTSKFWDVEEISKFWILAQDTINLNNQINFFKTHHAMCRYKNYDFTNEENTLAAIYVVRDPRNIVTSLSNHFSLSIENSKQFLFSESKRLVEPKRKFDKNIDVFNILGKWSDHYNSWKNYKKRKVLIIKYEELLENTQSKFLEILKFLSNYMEIKFSEEIITNAIKTTQFENLRKLEEQFGFSEAAKNTRTNESIKFFNQGQLNNWKTLLDKKIASEISSNFYTEMKELNYLN